MRRSSALVVSAAGGDCSALENLEQRAFDLVGHEVSEIARRLYEPWVESGGRVLWWDDPAWPVRLRDLEASAPLMLWVRGDLPDEESVAIVGSRRCTDYGRSVTAELARIAVDRGYAVVSGGATGIDVAAHSAALSAGGRSVVFLAGGAGTVYPSGHQQLFANAATTGAVIWEFPPPVPLRKPSFLVRNRLIAASAATTVVVEAAVRSGSLNTARTAADLGRLTLAVPGPVTSSCSTGTNQAIADGWASIILGADDFAAMIGTAPMPV